MKRIFYKNSVKRKMYALTLCAMFPLLFACTSADETASSGDGAEAESATSIASDETEPTATAPADGTVVAEGSGAFIHGAAYDVKQSPVVSAYDGRYRLDLTLARTEFGRTLDFSSYDTQEVYVAVSFDGLMPESITDGVHHHETLPLKLGKLPETIQLSITSEMNQFDEANEEMLQEFLRGDVDELLPAVYLFAPDGELMATFVTFAQASEIREGESYLTEESQPNLLEPEVEVEIDDAAPKAMVSLQKQNDGYVFQIQWETLDVEPAAFVYVSPDLDRPYALTSDDMATVALSDTATGEAITIPAEELFTTEVEKQMMDDFVNGKKPTIYLTVTLYSPDRRIQRSAEVPVQQAK